MPPPSNSASTSTSSSTCQPTLHVRAVSSNPQNALQYTLICTCSDFPPHSNPLIACFLSANKRSDGSGYEHVGQAQVLTDELNSNVAAKFDVCLPAWDGGAQPSSIPTPNGHNSRSTAPLLMSSAEKTLNHAFNQQQQPPPVPAPFALLKFNVYFTGDFRNVRTNVTQHVPSSSLQPSDLLGCLVVSVQQLLQHEQGVLHVLQQRVAVAAMPPSAQPTVPLLHPLTSHPPTHFTPPSSTPYYGISDSGFNSLTQQFTPYDPASNYLSQHINDMQDDDAPPPLPPSEPMPIPPAGRYELGASSSDSLTQYQKRNRMCGGQDTTCNIC